MSFSGILRALFTGSNLKNWFIGSSREREEMDTVKLYRSVRQAFDASPYAGDEAAADFMYQICKEACGRLEMVPSLPLGEALYACAGRLLVDDGSLHGFPNESVLQDLTLEEGSRLRTYLNRKRRFLENERTLLPLWREAVVALYARILEALPASVFDDDAEDNDGERLVALSVPLIDLCERPDEVVERAVTDLYDDALRLHRLFDDTRERVTMNALELSKIRYEDRFDTDKKVILPTQAKGYSPAGLVNAYLRRTPFEELFAEPLPFHIPFPVRFEHTHIVGGTGHGKTQLMQLLIYEDLLKAKEDGRSLVIMDSQGDLYRNISQLGCFNPGEGSIDEPGLSDRLMLIDPTDVEYPVCLNMFDWQRERVERLSPLEKEKVLNGTIELYEYFFGALLGAELTQRQGVIFKYLARLMMEIPEATVHTFRQLMEDGEPFRPFMERLPPTARSFFETRFFDRSFGETKKQILTRLWGVLANPTFERMFTHPRNKVDLFEATNQGKIILIHTAKDLLKQEGSAIFGRFFIALLSQAAMQRSTLAPHERRPTFAYIDEAQDYFDDQIGHLLNQARKYRVGMILAHQNLDQLSQELRASLLASTSIKFAGGLSAKDARLLSEEMRTDTDFLQGMRKRKKQTEFACFVKNLTPHAVKTTVPLGVVEAQPSLTERHHHALVTMNRDLYCALASEVRIPLPPPRKETAPRPTTARRAPVEEDKPLPQSVRERSYQAPSHLTEMERDEDRNGTPSSPPPSARQAEVFPPNNARPAATTPPEKPGRGLVPRRGPPIAVPALGRGGKQHQYLQHLVKEAAEQCGFRAVIEEQILEGAGRVDVSITRGDRRIACEISVTSSRDQELGNVEKCLAAGYDEVLLVTPTERQLETLKRFLSRHLEPKDAEKVHFLLPDAAIAHLGSADGATSVTEETIRGYRVKVTRQAINPAEAAQRRAVIAGVIAQSLTQAGKDP